MPNVSIGSGFARFERAAARNGRPFSVPSRFSVIIRQSAFGNRKYRYG
jgi:hypothetical protein